MGNRDKDGAINVSKLMFGDNDGAGYGAIETDGLILCDGEVVGIRDNEGV